MLTDERAMKVWREAYVAHVASGAKDNPATAVIAGRAGLVARIAELEEALKRCAQIVELHNWRQPEKVDDVKIIARAALKDTRNDD